MRSRDISQIHIHPMQIVLSPSVFTPRQDDQGRQGTQSALTIPDQPWSTNSRAGLPERKKYSDRFADQQEEEEIDQAHNFEPGKATNGYRYKKVSNMTFVDHDAPSLKQISLEIGELKAAIRGLYAADKSSTQEMVR